jgi:glycosyltransferase involved in cell wall biosynthesis
MVEAGREPIERRLALLSVVTPVFNEEDNVAELHARLVAALDGVEFELIAVDDGSTDATPARLDQIAQDDPRVQIITLSRNFGHQAAITAGLDHARGDATVVIDSDLQDPPELIPAMIERWREGYDVIHGVRSSRRGETRFKLATARWFYRLLGRLTEIEVRRDAGDFRLIDRTALDALGSLRERSRFLRGLSVWVGFRQTEVPYERDARAAGTTKYSLRKMIRFSFDAVSSFSNVPLQAATVLGFVFSIVAFLGIPIAIAFRAAGEFVPGITTVLLVVLLLGGIQLITVGIIGEYIGRVYEEVKQRPLYVIADQRNAPSELRIGE